MGDIFTERAIGYYDRSSSYRLIESMKNSGSDILNRIWSAPKIEIIGISEKR